MMIGSPLSFEVSLMEDHAKSMRVNRLVGINGPSVL
jgi:hypothetical protein